MPEGQAVPSRTRKASIVHSARKTFSGEAYFPAYGQLPENDLVKVAGGDSSERTFPLGPGHGP